MTSVEKAVERIKRDLELRAQFPLLHDEQHTADLRTILAALSGQGCGWRPIETASKDGSIVLIISTSPLWKYPFPAKWDKSQKWWVFADEPLNDLWGVSELVSHWMPLPPAPSIPPAGEALPTSGGGAGVREALQAIADGLPGVRAVHRWSHARDLARAALGEQGEA